MTADIHAARAALQSAVRDGFGVGAPTSVAVDVVHLVALLNHDADLTREQGALIAKAERWKAEVARSRDDIERREAIVAQKERAADNVRTNADDMVGVLATKMHEARHMLREAEDALSGKMLPEDEAKTLALITKWLDDDDPRRFKREKETQK